MMQIKLLKKFTIHPLFIFFLIISFLTGTFVHVFILICIVFIHELGHFIVATYYRWEIDEVVLWVFGGVMKTEDIYTRPLKEEIFVTVAGPMQHGFIYLLLMFFSYFQLMPDELVRLIKHYNLIIFLFNLLPIYPLDGGRFVLSLLYFVFPFRYAYRNMLIVSFVNILGLLFIQLFLFPFNLTSFLLFCFLLLDIYSYWKNAYFIFMRFLLHRLNWNKGKYKVEKLYMDGSMRLLHVFNQFMRHKRHIIAINERKCIAEKTCLKAYFLEHRYNDHLKDIS